MVACLALSLALSAAAASSALVTTAERSSFVRTGRYDEVLALCDAFARAHPRSARCETFGTSPEGRPMKVLVVADDVSKARDGRTVILAQGGIHAGEIDGKDAGFLVVRELLEGKVAKGALQKATLLFVPVFNVDGHERFGKNNRPNQRGPVEMGWRTTSWNLNLNRDYVKADAPEMRAMLALLNAWRPDLVVDLHATDGAQFRHDIAIMVDAARDPKTGAVAAGAAALEDRLLAALNGTRKDIGGHKALDFYPSFEKYDDPMSGAGVGAPPPRFSQAYWAARGGIGILVETHSWKDYKTRVKATRDLLVAVLEDARDHGASWRDGLDGAARPREVALAWENGDDKRTIDFLGYAYTRELSPISGALATTYDERRPQVWRMPFLTSLRPRVTVSLPRAYLVPCGVGAWVRPLLDLHAVPYTLAGSGAQARRVEEMRFDAVTFGAKPYEGRMTAKAQGAWRARADRYAPAACDLVVEPTPLAAHLLEPQGPDSLVSWGSFNGVFEQKEYMEPYVAEAVAREMLRDPKVRAAFHAKLEEPEFARDPAARLEFFYRLHPSYDARKDVYPVLRVLE